MKFGFKHIFFSTALFGLTAPVAMAQSVDNPFLRGRYTAVTERSQGDFDPESLRAGAFEISSSLGLATAYNSNIFASPKSADNDTSDTIFRVSPEIEARSNWSSHELNAGLSVDYKDYQRYETETVTDYNAFVGGRIDVLRTFQLRGQAFATHASEQRYEPGSAGVTDPIEYDRIGANAGAVLRRDRVQLDGMVGTIADDFDNTVSFRDVTENYLYGRGSYAISPDVAFFIQGRTAELDYDSPGTALVRNRDGTRSSVEVGASFELQAPFRGEIAVGSATEEKDDPAQPDIEGLSLDGRLLWFPTQLTTVTFHANRGITDSGIAAVASATNTRYGVRVDHELRRNIVLYGEAAFGTYAFEGISREDEFSDTSAGVAYKLNKRAHLEFGYRFHNSSGATPDRDIEQHIVSIGLRIYP